MPPVYGFHSFGSRENLIVVIRHAVNQGGHQTYDTMHLHTNYMFIPIHTNCTIFLTMNGENLLKYMDTQLHRT